MSLSERLQRGLVESKINHSQVEWVPQPELLLCPNVPKPLHGVAPRIVLGSKWWNATRQAAYRSTDYHCLACGVAKVAAAYHQWLEGHELYEINYSKGRAVYLETVPLCHFCHNSIHDGRLLHLLQKGEIHQAKYVAILQHRDRVLAAAGLSKPSMGEREAEFFLMERAGKIAPWNKWRMIINGKQYKPFYASYEDWKKAFGVSE